MGGNTVVGLLGGGQLGRMLCQAAGPLNIDVGVLDEENAPAKQAHNSGRHVTGSFRDAAKIRELAKRSDYLSVEIEHVDTEILEEIERDGVQITLTDGRVETHRPPIHPSWRTLRLIQDKYLQKEHFHESSFVIPVAEQIAIDSGDAAIPSLKQAGEKLGFPFMLKARKGSYDGRGNFKVRSEDDFDEAMSALGNLPLYAEKWARFVKELAVMVIRTEDEQGDLEKCVAYPAVETVHEDSICTRVFMPPREVKQEISDHARALAISVVETLWGRGVFAVEMFLMEDETLLVNEVAPRPHNSGHYTIEAVPQMSQFKAQLHAVIGLPIPDRLIPRVRSAIMVNILGGASANSHHELNRLARSRFRDKMDVHLHLYNKQPKPGRKIGHITMTGFCTIDELEKEADDFFALADAIRQERIHAKPEQLRPEEARPTPVNGDFQAPHAAALLPDPDPSSSPAGPTPKSARKPELVKRKTSTRTVTGVKHGATERGRETVGDANQPLVLVTMGSDSDLPVLKAGLDVLKQFKVPYTLDITSAHRTPRHMMHVAENAVAKGIKVIIAAAGGAAHLPGMLSSGTPLPVIGVPVKATHLDGLDSLLSIVQMPRGVPTATVGINNSTNAALLAVRILGAFIPPYQEQMLRYQQDLEEAVLQKGNKLKSIGDSEYLKA